MKLVKFALIGLILFLSGIANAQDHDNSSKIDEMHSLKWQTLATEAHLTPKDIEVVQPVFMEYEKSMWNMHKQNHDFFKSALKNAKKVTPNYADLNDRYVENLFKEAQMFRSYHLQLRKLLSPETLFKYYKAEREYKRKLLQEYQEHRSQEKQKQ